MMQWGSVTAFGIIPKVITDLKANSHNVHSNKYARGQQNGGESFLCVCVCVADVTDRVVRKNKTRIEREEWEKRMSRVRGEDRSREQFGRNRRGMWRGEKNSKWKDEDWISTSQTRTVPASKQKDEKMTGRCSVTDGWTVPHLPDGSPSLWLPLLLQVSNCQCPISTLKTITGLPGAERSAESANKRGRVHVTERGGRLRIRTQDEKEKGRGERTDESF